MFKQIIFISALFVCLSSSAQDILGKWKTYDVFDKNVPESIVEIYSIDDRLYVKIVEILPDEHKNDLCNNCQGSLKGKPILGMVILEGAELKDGIWQGAKVLNAKNGKRFSLPGSDAPRFVTDDPNICSHLPYHTSGRSPHTLW